jgi:hypothetical protein
MVRANGPMNAWGESSVAIVRLAFCGHAELLLRAVEQGQDRLARSIRRTTGTEKRNTTMKTIVRRAALAPLLVAVAASSFMLPGSAVHDGSSVRADEGGPAQTAGVFDWD